MTMLPRNVELEATMLRAAMAYADGKHAEGDDLARRAEAIAASDVRSAIDRAIPLLAAETIGGA